MTIHPLTVKDLRKILEHDTDSIIPETCSDNQNIIVVDKNSHPLDEPLGAVVNIEFKRGEPVKIIIERNTECHVPLKP